MHPITEENLKAAFAGESQAHVNPEGFSELIAVEYCNVHGLWEGSLKL